MAICRPATRRTYCIGLQTRTFGHRDCRDRETDISQSMKAYGARVLIQVQTIMTSNNTERDIIPSLSLDYDCCTPERKTVDVNNILL